MVQCAVDAIFDSCLPSATVHIITSQLYLFRHLDQALTAQRLTQIHLLVVVRILLKQQVFDWPTAPLVSHCIYIHLESLVSIHHHIDQDLKTLKTLTLSTKQTKPHGLDCNSSSSNKALQHF